MVPTRSLKALRDGSENPAKPADTRQPPASSKRKSQVEDAQSPSISKNKRVKAEELVPAEDDKENIGRPTTPPAQSKTEVEPQQHEKTPGRVGPIINLPSPGKPDIKPFKGPKGQKVRKTWYEKEEEYKQFIRENPGHVFHEYVSPDDLPPHSKILFYLHIVILT